MLVVAYALTTGIPPIAYYFQEPLCWAVSIVECLIGIAFAYWAYRLWYYPLGTHPDNAVGANKSRSWRE